LARLSPRLRLLAGHPEEAHTIAEQALAQAREHQERGNEAYALRPLVAHCHRSLVTLYATTGQTEQARVELSTAIEMYRAMDMTFWLPQTEVALAQEKER
jgi:hypothetical protein